MINDFTPVSQRNIKWIEKTCIEISKFNSSTEGEAKNDKMLWDYYNNKPNFDKYSFLRKAGENIELPVYQYHIPLQRILIDALVSQQAERMANFSVILTDEESIKEKYDNGIAMYINTMLHNAELKSEMMLQAQNQIIQKLQEFEQVLQQQPSNEEEAAKLQEAYVQYEQIKQQSEIYLKQIEKQSILTNKEIDAIKYHQKYNWSDIKEVIAQKTLKKLFDELNIPKISKDGFLSRCVTGKARYFVYYDGNTKLPEFRVLNPINVSYQPFGDVTDISKGRWVKVKEYMSIHNIISIWGRQIEKKYGIEELKSLTEFSGVNIGDGLFASTPNNGAIFIDDISTYSANNGILVERIFYKVNRKQIIKYSPNINGGDDDVFRHYIDCNKEIINKDEYNYKTVTDNNGVKKEYYVNKKNKNIVYDAKTVELYSSKKGEYYKEKYLTDRYEAVVINKKYVVDAKKSEYICRNKDKYYDINLPVFGNTYTSGMETPYSLISSTIDLQDLYDVVYMEQQLMIALSGAKGQIIDRSQKPTSMSDEEWEYNWKMGRGYIQTKDENGNPINPSYNQWTSFDNTLSPSIQYLSGILMQLENTMCNIIGVSRQKLGRVVPSDQVSTFEMAIQQSELVTEILFYEHDVEIANALTELLHLALRYCYVNNDIINLTDRENNNDMFMIPANYLNNIQFSVKVINGMFDERLIKDIRNLALNQWKAGTLGMGELVDTMMETSLTKLKVKVKYWEEKNQELAQMQREANKRDMIEIEEAKIKLKNEYEADYKNSELAIKQGMLELEKRNQDINMAIAQRNQELQAISKQQEQKLKLLSIMTERESELSLLNENIDARKTGQQIQLLQMQINALMKDMNVKQKFNNNVNKLPKMFNKKIVKEHILD